MAIGIAYGALMVSPDVQGISGRLRSGVSLKGRNESFMYQNRLNLEKLFILFLDLCCIAGSLVLAYLIRFGSLQQAVRRQEMLGQLFLLSVLYLLISFFVNFTHDFFTRGRFDEIISLCGQQLLLVIFWITVNYLRHTTNELSRIVFGCFFLISLLMCYLFRLLFKNYMLKIWSRSRNASGLLLITDRAHREELEQMLASSGDWNRRLEGTLLTEENTPDEIVAYITRNPIDEVFIAYARTYEPPVLTGLISTLELMGVTVNVNIGEFDLLPGSRKRLDRVGRYSVVSFARNRIPLRQRLMKRALDIAGSLVGLVILALFSVFVAPAILLDSPGPVIFSQIRMGKNGRRFRLYKFRSMYVDAEARKAALMEKNEMKGLMFKMEDDPRITRVGRFIRRTSIDELPQFWNVLRGDMSLVGTRPPTEDEYNRYEAAHKARLSMPPGITGLWQISGRSDIRDFDEVVRLDMEYIDDWTIKKDIKILIQTVGVVFSGKGSR